MTFSHVASFVPLGLSTQQSQHFRSSSVGWRELTNFTRAGDVTRRPRATKNEYVNHKSLIDVRLLVDRALQLINGENARFDCGHCHTRDVISGCKSKTHRLQQFWEVIELKDDYTDEEFCITYCKVQTFGININFNVKVSIVV